MVFGGVRSAAAGVAAMMVVAVVVTGCSVDPQPISRSELAETLAADHAAIVNDQEQIAAPLTLYEAMARVVIYNLDNRTRMMEEALSNEQLDLAKFDMLPTLAYQAGFTSRDQPNASSSRSILTEYQSLEKSTSSDRDHITTDARFSWNVLDFGVSYYQAKQQSDRFLIAQSNRKKLMSRLMQQARTAFFRAAAAQRLKPEVKTILGNAKKALVDIDKADSENLRPRLATLQTKRTLIEIVGQLEALDEQLSLAEVELKSLINVYPTTKVELVMPETKADLPVITANPEDLELLALVNSSDVREVLYQLRIEQLESKKALLRILPGLEFFASVNFDSNYFLVNNVWREAGMRSTWNLMRVLALGSTLDVAEAKTKLAETKRMALGMAVISRLHMSLWRYRDTVNQYNRANQIDEIERDLSVAAAAAETADAGNAIERIRNEASALRARMRSYESYATAHDSLGAVFVSLGLDPIPENYRQIPVAELAQRLSEKFGDWEAGRLPEVVPEPESAPEAKAADEQSTTDKVMAWVTQWLSDYSF